MTDGNGRIALVTGASRGIGRAIALELAAAGIGIIAHYARERAGAEETAQQIIAAGGKASILGADVRDEAQIGALFQQVDAELAARGHDRLDILVNNAGIGGGGNWEKVNAQWLDDLFDVNAKGLFLVTQQAIPRLRDGGRIINISSMVSLAAYPGSIAYAMSKAAVNSFTRSLAVDMGRRNITVNAVAPGATATEFIQPILDDPKLFDYYSQQSALKRMGEPQDIARVVAFLASPAGGWVTGQVIQASGGMHL